MHFHVGIEGPGKGSLPKPTITIREYRGQFRAYYSQDKSRYQASFGEVIWNFRYLEVQSSHNQTMHCACEPDMSPLNVVAKVQL